jgi:hypothetical protein
MTTSAANGRLADSKISDALGWVSGVRLDVRQSTNLILVVTDEQGVFIINKLGRLHLPAVARNWCRLNAGDRLLLAAYPQGGLVVVHAPAAPDEVVDRVYAEALEGGVRMSKSTLDSAGFEAARPLLERMGIHRAIGWKEDRYGRQPRRSLSMCRLCASRSALEPCVAAERSGWSLLDLDVGVGRWIRQWRRRRAVQVRLCLTTDSCQFPIVVHDRRTRARGRPVGAPL